MSLPRIFAIGLVLLFTYTHLQGQFNAVHQAEKKMEQGNWGNARQILTKALRKDTLNVQAELVLSRWFLNPNNPSKQVDSAYFHNLKALHHFQKSSPKQKEKLRRDHIDSTSLVRLRVKIDSLAFDEAKQINTEQSYQGFISRYPLASEVEAAIELRDEVAFVNVLRQNSYLSFEKYLNQYPQSHRAREAKERYEKLLFESKTKDKKLKSYLSFVHDFPSSPYKSIADKNIFELETVGGTPDDFAKFIVDFPKSSYLHRAHDFLFYLAQDDIEKIPNDILTDSLKKIIEINKLLWVPFYKNGKYGFMDSRGVETFAPQFESIKEEYKCGSVKDDILVTSGGLISRNGIRLTDRAAAVSDLGYGFLKVADSSCVKILHKSGVWLTESCVQEAVVLNGRFLAIRIDGLVGLYSLAGRALLPAEWSSIEMTEGVIILDRMGKKTLCLPSQIALVADGLPLPENFVFDNVKSLGGGLLLVGNGSLEGIMNSKLEFVVPLERQSLYQMPFGLVRKVNDRFIFANLSPELENTSWEHYRFYRQWLLLKDANAERLFDLHSKRITEANPDSLWVANGLVLAGQKDSIHVHINSSTKISLAKNAKITFVKSADSIRYFFTEQKNKKTIFSIETGEKLFSMEYDQIESLPFDLFMITRKNKKGLVNKSGKPLLPYEYDALVLNSKNQLSLLSNKKFGLYDIHSGKLIKPIFERNISVLDNQTLLAFKEGYYGLIDWEAKPITGFDYDEILLWSENVIWTKKGFEWTLTNFREGHDLLRRIKSFRVFSVLPEEKLALVKQENYFGVLSSKNGLIIPPSFSFVLNLGSESEPLYFTAKEVEEAGIVVVIYYDRSGKLLRKQVYEDEEYARIVCPED